MYEELFAALAAANVRYVVVGGVAVVLHGYPRLTADVDLVLDLERSNIERAIHALLAFGLRPMLPADAMQFADPDIRRDWVENRNMNVFSLTGGRDSMLTVDLFVSEPFPFGDLWSSAESASIGAVDVRIASIPHLIAMKRQAGRAQDQQDILKLEQIERERRT